MGVCYSGLNIGEDYVLSLVTNMKINHLSSNDVIYWIELKKKKMTSSEVKNDIEYYLMKETELREETLNLVKKESEQWISFSDFEDYAKDSLYETSHLNKNADNQFAILKSLFARHYEFNHYHFALSVISFTKDLKKVKINTFFEICSKIKRNFDFNDFNLYFFSYLYSNLAIISQTVSNNKDINNYSLKNDLEYLVSTVYTDSNIKAFRDNLLSSFKLEKTSIGIKLDEHIMTKEDLHQIFFDREYIFNIKDLRAYYLIHMK